MGSPIITILMSIVQKPTSTMVIDGTIGIVKPTMIGSVRYDWVGSPAKTTQTLAHTHTHTHTIAVYMRHQFCFVFLHNT